MKRKAKKNLKRIILLVVILIVLLAALILSLQYEKEGEKNLPFTISKLLVVNTIEGEKSNNPNFIWDFKIKQNNDVYIYFEKLDESQVLESITIDNFKITEMPLKGNIRIYRPTGEFSNLYKDSEVDLINHEIVYNAGKYDNLENLETSMQGGVVAFRISNEEIENYTSNEDTEIVYDGTLLTKTQTALEDIKFKISFDLTIETKDGLKFKGTMELGMPLEDLINKGKSTIEITDFKDIVFKRIK